MSSLKPRSSPIDRCKPEAQKDFIARGLASAAEARRTGIYYTAEEVIARLRQRVERARRRKALTP